MAILKMTSLSACAVNEFVDVDMLSGDGEAVSNSKGALRTVCIWGCVQLVEMESPVLCDYISRTRLCGQSHPVTDV